MNKSPAFQFYPSDYLSDMKVRMIPWASRGLYIDLICYCWLEGYIPKDSSAIAQLCGCHDLAIIEPCLQLFTEHPEDPTKLIHKRVEKERNKQKAFRENRIEAGKKGAKLRWNKGKQDPSPTTKTENSSAIDLPLAKNSFSSSSSSTDITHSPKRRYTKSEKKSVKVSYISPTMERIGGWFNRRPGTLWSIAEVEALQRINPTHEELDTMESRYTSGTEYLRQDVITLLNNWQGELDKARCSVSKAQKPSLDHLGRPTTFQTKDECVGTDGIRYQAFEGKWRKIHQST